MSNASTIDELLHAIESSKTQYQQQQTAFANNMAQRLIVTMQQVESGLPYMLQEASAYELMDAKVATQLRERCKALQHALSIIDWQQYM